ncbi:conserved protein of unknown function [Candidatus Nitrospira inopinata]|uniref:Uncharacterized protein n=1 Tax=Candidatus Nitrospira inopinata TaxID=1715989 RepID=A0A0S4KS25_9BACT|nr:conserved protein of unknown function [Candidatus Nitrospira inopinata]
MGFRPEEKGIKTQCLLRLLKGRGMGFRPEEKGIKTREQTGAHHVHIGMGFRPEEKGIKTP